ncbi:MAG TPA: uracil-DNA glycosylase [Burkholderiales bacterium]|jgi:uracil-DNA glycosylase family 4|nr:uracil-DNA glycosylase [Burkholderiales bacterium]
MARATSGPAREFTTDCRDCSRLADFLADVRAKHADYHARPVPAFGDASPRLLVVGLAPGMHGANRSGRPFTGDHAGILLYRTLHKFGFATRPESISADDGLELPGCRITNAVRCVPPENKPTGEEVNRCNGYLAGDLRALARGSAVLALGGIAHKAVLTACGEKAGAFKFAHAARHDLASGLVLFDSYHCSRYNTNTGRLTDAMFEQVFSLISHYLRNRP